MIKAPDNDSEGTLTEFLLNFIPVVDLFLRLVKIVSLVIVESMVIYRAMVSIWVRVLILTIYLTLYELANALVLRIQIKIVYYLEGRDLVPLILREISAVYSQCVFGGHGEGGTATAGLLPVLFVLRVLADRDHAHRLFRALRVRDVSLIVMVVFLARHASVLL